MPVETITTREIADMLRISRQAVYKAICSGRLPNPVHRIGRRGNYWKYDKKLVYILENWQYNKSVGNVSQTYNRRPK